MRDRTRGIYCSCGEAKEHIHVNLCAGVAPLTSGAHEKESRTTATRRVAMIAVQCKPPLHDSAQSRVASLQSRGAPFRLQAGLQKDKQCIDVGKINSHLSASHPPIVAGLHVNSADVDEHAQQGGTLRQALCNDAPARISSKATSSTPY